MDNSCSFGSQSMANENSEKLPELMMKRRKIAVPDKLAWKPLHVAVKQNNEQMVNVLLAQPETQINYRSFDGYTTSLLVGCETNSPNLEIIEQLLIHQANPNLSNKDYITPLHFACKYGKLQLVKLLIQYGADINRQDVNKKTPLHYSVERNSTEIIQYLLLINADANLTDEKNVNPLMLAVAYSKLDAADLLLPHTENVNCKALDNWTALMFTVHLNNLTLTDKLIKRGAQPYLHVRHCTPLYLAVKNCNYDMINLIWRNTDYGEVSKDEHFIFSTCVYWTINEHYKCFELIFNTRQVDLNINNTDGIFKCLFRNHNLNFDAKFKYFDVINWFLNNGVKLSTDDTEVLIRYFANCPYKIEILELIFDRTMPSVPGNFVTSALKNESPSVAALLLRYCCNVDADYLFACIMLQPKLKLDVFKYFLLYFSPSDIQSLTLIASYANRKDISVLLERTVQVKSLAELSRNAVRKLLRSRCKTGENFIRILKDTGIPKHVQEIVRFLVPVNTYFND